MESTLRTQFLSELRIFEQHMEGRRAKVGVPSDDPDVQRLIEAIAFFSARTRQLADERLAEAVGQVALGSFDAWLTPEPARVMLEARPRHPVERPLPRGTQFVVKARDGTEAMFTTTRELALAPIQLVGSAFEHTEQGCRLVLKLRAPQGKVALPQPLSLYLDYLADDLESARLQQLLREHLRSISVYFDREPGRGAPDASCDWQIGAPACTPHEVPAPAYEALRAFFAFPRQDHYLNVQAPPQEFEHASLCLELSGDWPRDTRPTHRDFGLFVVQLQNLHDAAAATMTWDGTREVQPIVPTGLHPDAALHSVRGVYEQLQDGTRPLLPHALDPETGYSLQADGAGRPALRLRRPGAFAAPRRVVVEGRWHQPTFSSHAGTRLRAHPHARHLRGVEWSLRGDMAPHHRSPIASDPRAVLRLLGLKNRAELSLEDLFYLLRALGVEGESPHGAVLGCLRALAVEDGPADPVTARGLKRTYRVTLDAIEPEQKGLVVQLLIKTWELLQAWSPVPVELAVTGGRHERALLPAGGLS